MVRHASKPKIEKYVPSDKKELSNLSDSITAAFYSARKDGIPVDLAALKSTLATDDQNLSDSHKNFVGFLVDLISEIVSDVYECENTEQNPTWMPQRPLDKERYQLPKDETQLKAKVNKEVMILFGHEKRAEKENRIVRWSQKKRDRVDQILVRELHGEEHAWTDYSADEVVVKDQLANSVMDLLLEDTIKEVVKLFNL